MFSDIVEVYKFYSSKALFSAIMESRKKLFNMLRKSSPKAKSLASISKEYGTCTEMEMAMKHFLFAKEFVTISENDDDEDDDDDQDVDDYAEEAKYLGTFSEYVFTMPLFKEYSRFCSSMNNVIKEALQSEFNELTVKGLLMTFDELIMQYALDVSIFFDSNISSKYDSSRSMVKYLADRVWDPTKDGMQTRTGNNIPHNEALDIQEFLVYLRSSDLPDAVIKYLLNPIIGTAGVATNAPTGFPIYVTFVPLPVITQNGRYYWSKRIEHMDDQSIEPNQFDDERQTHCEKLFVERLKQRAIKFASQRKVDNPKSDPDLENNDEGNEANEGDKADEGPVPSGSSTKSRPNNSGKPKIPDDSNYQPDVYLSSKAIEFTEYVQGLPANDMSHDHMTRFNVNFEAATSLSRWQLIDDKDMGNDFVIETLERGVKTRFLVTYTRKSRKPIFSIIS